jgi:hypothetical protein
MTISSWDQTRASSTYHFDNRRPDLPEDVVTYLGQLDSATWKNDIAEIVSSSRPASWGTRGYKGEGIEAFNDTYNKIKALTEDRWITKLYGEYGGGLSLKQLDIVYNMAYDKGHSYGHEEVAMYFSDFVNFALNILKAK